LRNEVARLETKLAAKSEELQLLQSELEPLRTSVTQLEGELELTAGYLAQEKENRELLQKRFDKFKNNSEKIDPKELEDLKKSFDDIQTERDQLAEQVTSLREEIESLQQKAQSDGSSQASAIADAVREAKKQQHEKFQTQHRERMAAKNEVIETITKERDETRTQLETVQQELNDAQQQLASVQALADQSKEQIVALQQEVVQLRITLGNAQQERDEALARASTGTQPATDVTMGEEGQIDEGASQDLSEEIANLRSLLETAKQQLTAAQNQANRADNDAAALKVKMSFMNDEITELRTEEVNIANMF
jgi:chromosome segregation ATPase